MDEALNYDYGETMCQAIDTLIGVALEGLSYDITKQCTIVDDTDRANGRYIVSDGAVKFEAFSEVTNYKEGTVVYVTIPNGDYNMQKIITGRQVGTQTQPFVYTAPLENLISIYDSGSEVPAGQLLANHPTEFVKNIWTKDCTTEDFNGFTRLGISADFKAWLAPMNTSSGTYGVRLTLWTIEPALTGATEDGAAIPDKEQIRQLTLSTNDMYGNPYGFESFFNQEKAFDISSIKKIKKMSLDIFQSRDFIDYDKNPIPYQQQIDNFDSFYLPNNIFIQNIQVFMGYDQSSFTQDTLMIYTDDSLGYTNKSADRDINQKTIKLRWIHKDENEQRFRLVESSELDNTKLQLRWYRYEFGTADADEYSGAYWSLFDTNTLSVTFDPNILAQEEMIRAIGLVNTAVEEEETAKWVPYYSETLVFTNNFEVASVATVNAAKGLQIGNTDNSEGNYFIYDQNGKLIEAGMGSGYDRYFNLHFNGSPLDSIEHSLIKGTTSKITWYIPKENSMIKLAKSFYENSTTFEESTDTNAIERNSKHYYRITYEGAQLKNGFKQQYNIRDHWKSIYGNNTVECVIDVDGQEYHAIEELNFGQAGTSGTNVTLVLEIENNETSLLRKKDAAIEIAAYLYDNSGLIDEDKYKNQLTWSWMELEHFTPKLLRKKLATDTAELAVDETGFTRIWVTQPDDLDGVMTHNFHILQATISDWVTATGEKYDLIAYLPIPIRNNANYTRIEGPREIIYDMQGNPSYNPDPYKLFLKENVEKTDLKEWKINHCYVNGSSSLKADAFSPALKETVSGYVLKPNAFYVKNRNNVINVLAVNNSDSLQWSQPVLILQNPYGFSMLNNWNGDLTIDEKNGTILSTMIGAGHKNSDNTFSGVLMGDVQQGTDKDDFESKTGVYGFDHGITSFALKEDGSATFGAVGKGQIQINGTSGTIQSGNYETNSNGMSINLNDGRLYIKDGGKRKIVLQPNDPQFEVFSENDTALIHVGSDKYYLQSDGYSSAATDYGSYLDLNNGLFKTKSANGAVTLSGKGEPYFRVEATTDNDDVTGAPVYINLMYMGSNGYYLQSSKYQGVAIKTIGNYQIYKNSSNKTVAVPFDYLTNNSSNIYLVSGDTITSSIVTIPTTYEENVYANDGTISGTKTTSIPNPRQSYLSTLIPILEADSKNGNGLFIDLNSGIINGYDLYLRGTNRETGEAVIINSGAPTTPFSVGDGFKVNWDGTLTCQKVNYLGTGPNTGQYIININDHFTVTPGGGVSGTTGNFGGGWFGGTAARVSVGSGGASTTIAGISNNEIVNTGYSVSKMSQTIKALSDSINAITDKLNSFISTYNNHDHYVNVSGSGMISVLTDLDGGTASINRIWGVKNSLGQSYSGGPRSQFSSNTTIPSPPSGFSPSIAE